jgi:hypothetical protein
MWDRAVRCWRRRRWCGWRRWRCSGCWHGCDVVADEEGQDGVVFEVADDAEEGADGDGVVAGSVFNVGSEGYALDRWGVVERHWSATAYRLVVDDGGAAGGGGQAGLVGGVADRSLEANRGVSSCSCQVSGADLWRLAVAASSGVLCVGW